METAETALSDKEKKAFYDILFPMMEQNMQRLSDDLDWFCDKFDYRNKDADWRILWTNKKQTAGCTEIICTACGIFTTQNMFSISNAIIL